MNGKTILCFISFLAALAVGAPGSCFADATLTVTPAGDGVFLLQGTGVADAGAMDITITYDGAALANPRVVPGDLITGALTAVNAGMAGTVRIGIIRTAPIHGDGVIATLRFDRKGEAAGGIQALTASLSNLAGKTLPVQLRVAAPRTSPGLSDPPRDEETTGTTTPASIAPVASVPGTVSGVVTGLAAQEEAVGEEIRVGGEDEEVTAAPKVAPLEEPVSDKVEPRQEIMVLASVLDRFQDHRGERSVETFTALFEQSGAGGFSQTPSPLLADGKSVLAVDFVAAPGDIHVAEMTATGARLLSLQPAPDDPQTWVAQLRPERGVLQASLTVPLQTYAIVFPLVVAPRLNIDLDKSGRVTPADFALFLKKRSAFDLNGDGKLDYRDDYLFTANYLVSLRGEEKSGGPPPKAP